MRLFLTLSILSFCVPASSQNCKPNIDVKVNICGARYFKDSICPVCNDCRGHLVPSDTSFSILSFTATASGEGFDGDIREAQNQGSTFNSPILLSILVRLRRGSYIEFSCIKAKRRNGIIYILQPLFIELK